MAASSKDIILKPCEIESCKRISATLCHHCEKNVCRFHFVEHADQVIEELHPLADSINKLGEKISSFSIEESKQNLLNKLTEWRNRKLEKINKLYELNKQKLDIFIPENEGIFSQQTTDHLSVVDTLRDKTVTFIGENEVTFEQLQMLKENLRILEENVNKTHTRLVYCDIKPLFIDYASVLIYPTTDDFMYGGTLLSIDYQLKLNEFYGNPEQKWKLIYKATEDGFNTKDFHRCCDNQGPTMTIIQSKHENYLFGGYTEIPWTGDHTYKKDPKAFLFTLKNPHDLQPTKFPIKSNGMNAICHSNYQGPCFGGVIKDKNHFVDISISSDADKQNSSFSFPSSYVDTTGKGNTLFTGDENFKLEDMELYGLLMDEN